MRKGPTALTPAGLTATFTLNTSHDQCGRFIREKGRYRNLSSKYTETQEQVEYTASHGQCKWEGSVRPGGKIDKRNQIVAEQSSLEFTRPTCNCMTCFAPVLRATTLKRTESKAACAGVLWCTDRGKCVTQPSREVRCSSAESGTAWLLGERLRTV